jgi:hypothetical protein
VDHAVLPVLYDPSQPYLSPMLYRMKLQYVSKTNPLIISSIIIETHWLAGRINQLIGQHYGPGMFIPEEIQRIHTEIPEVCRALDKFSRFLGTTIMDKNTTFVEGCILRSTVEECHSTVKRIYVHFKESVLKELEESTKENFEKDAQSLSRFCRIFDFRSVSQTGLLPDLSLIFLIHVG